MPPFPLMSDLPAVLNVQGWSWAPYDTPGPYPKTFRVGTDRDGHQWLTKARGSFYAYREIVFDRLAQKLGWSCQSSAFGVFPASSPPLSQIGAANGELIHAIHWLIPEHQFAPCCESCPLPAINSEGSVGVLRSRLSHISDWPRSEIAACLFGANESPGKLFATNHEFVILDAEQMFYTSPSDVRETIWWNATPESSFPSGRDLTFEVCSKVAALTDTDLKEILAVPSGVHIRYLWSIKEKLRQAREYARLFVRTPA